MILHKYMYNNPELRHTILDFEYRGTRWLTRMLAFSPENLKRHPSTPALFVSVLPKSPHQSTTPVLFRYHCCRRDRTYLSRFTVKTQGQSVWRSRNSAHLPYFFFFSSSNLRNSSLSALLLRSQAATAVFATRTTVRVTAFIGRR